MQQRIEPVALATHKYNECWTVYGPKIDSDLDILKMVRDAIDVGASGITMGRNIWGHNDIAGMTAALSSIIHDDSSVENAQKYLK